MPGMEMPTPMRRSIRREFSETMPLTSDLIQSTTRRSSRSGGEAWVTNATISWARFRTTRLALRCPMSMPMTKPDVPFSLAMMGGRPARSAVFSSRVRMYLPCFSEAMMLDTIGMPMPVKRDRSVRDSSPCSRSVRRIRFLRMRFFVETLLMGACRRER